MLHGLQPCFSDIVYALCFTTLAQSICGVCWKASSNLSLINSSGFEGKCKHVTYVVLLLQIMVTAETSNQGPNSYIAAARDSGEAKMCDQRATTMLQLLSVHSALLSAIRTGNMCTSRSNV